MPSSKQKVATLAFWSIVVAFAVMGLKFVAWKITGSVALYSDALESIVNVIAAAAAFWAITSATSRPTRTIRSATTRPSISRPCSKAC